MANNDGNIAAEDVAIEYMNIIQEVAFGIAPLGGGLESSS